MSKHYRFLPLIGASLGAFLVPILLAAGSPAVILQILRSGFINRLAQLGFAVFMGTVLGACIFGIVALFLKRKLKKKSEAVSDKVTELNAKPIGGWLIIMAVWFSLAPVLHLFGIVQHAAILKHYSPKLFFGYELLISIVLFILAAIVCICFLTKKKITPKLAVIYMLTAVGLETIRFIIVAPLVGKPLKELFIFILIPAPITLIFWILMSSIWSFYFIRSKRVKATFC